MKTLVSTNRSGKFIPPPVINPREGSINRDAAFYPGYVVLLDESRLVRNADGFLACAPYRLIVGLFVMPVEEARPKTYRISYIGRVQSISEEFLADSSPEPLRTITFAPVCRTGMGPCQGVFELESIVSCNAKVMDMMAYHANEMIFRPSYDIAVPDIVQAGNGVSSFNITFETSFDVPQTWTFSLQNGTAEGTPGTMQRGASSRNETFRAITVAADKIAIKNSGQGDNNIITPLVEMFTGTSKLKLMGTYVSSFASPVAGELSHNPHRFYWLAFYKYKNSMTIETRLVRHGDDVNTIWSLGASSSITVLYSKS